MSTELDICNLACSHIGESAIVSSISPPSPSNVLEKNCARFYPVVRNAALAADAFPWSCNTRRTILADIGDPPASWLYRYALPANVMNVIAVKQAEYMDDDTVASEDFTVETDSNGARVLYTNLPYANLLYGAYVTNATTFPPGLVIAISHGLARFLAGAVIKGRTGIQVAEAQRKLYELELPKAQLTDARGMRKRTTAVTDIVPSAIKARS